jgi:hypothetical protein
MLKKLVIAAAVLAIVVFVGMYLLIGNLDKILKGAIEGVGAELLGVPVTVAEVRLDLKSGVGQINGMRIANPDGFQAANAFQMDTIRLAVDIRSLTSQPLVIDELTISNPVVDLEAKADGTTNLQQLLDNISNNSAKADEKAAAEHPSTEGQQEAGKKEPVKLSFKKLAITGVTLNASVPGQDSAQVVIPDTIKENVGGAEGFTPAQVGGVIIGDIVSQSLQAALEKKLTEKVEEAAKGFFDNLKSKLEGE